jgi:CRP-like cAMP-binding protein
MSLVFDTLRISSVTDELSDDEINTIKDLFEVRKYKAGDVIVRPGEERSDELYILAEGSIEVKEEGSSLSVLHVLKRGEMAGMITFVGGSSSQVSATLRAVGDVKVLSLTQSKVEQLVGSHPMIVYRIMRGVARTMQGIVKRGNTLATELSNYINRGSRLY